MEELCDGSLCWISVAAGWVAAGGAVGGLLWVFVEDMCSEPCCSGVCFAVGVMGAMPLCFDVSWLWLHCFGVVLFFCCGCCFESAVVGCAVVLWVLVGRLEVLSHEVIWASVDEGVVSCMCVALCGALDMWTVWCAHAWMLCALK